jgi:hypothetical protein
MRKPTLQVLITRYVAARNFVRADWSLVGMNSAAYAAACRASYDAFDACVECCVGQLSVKETIAAFRELEDARMQ